MINPPFIPINYHLLFDSNNNTTDMKPSEEKIKTTTSLNKTKLSTGHISSVTEVKRKVQEKSLEEQVYETPIKNIEAERLNRVFDKICGNPYKGSKKEKEEKEPESLRDKFDKKDVMRVLSELNFHYNKPEIDQWIWEVDEDLDGCVNRYEFTLMYKRCIFDKNGLEPRNLFNLVQFLMYDQTERGRITVEDTLQLIYVRFRNPDSPDSEQDVQKQIEAIFGKEEKTPDGLEREIPFEEYLKQIRKKDLERRKELEKERKEVKEVIKKKEK